MEIKIQNELNSLMEEIMEEYGYQMATYDIIEKITKKIKAKIDEIIETNDPILIFPLEFRILGTGKWEMLNENGILNFEYDV